MKFIIKNDKEIFDWNGKYFTKNDMAPTPDLWAIHPANLKSIKYNKNPIKADVNIYTDGSEQNGRCRASYVVIDKDGGKIFKPPNYSSNFEAEAIAIKKALERIRNIDNSKSYQILTDSLSVLKGLEDAYNKGFYHFPLGHWKTQAVSVHRRFPYYLRKFGIIEEEKCKCGQVASSFDHYLTCSFMKNERETKLVTGPPG